MKPEKEPKRGLNLEYKCRRCNWHGSRGDLDVDQCPECESFDIRTTRW